MAPPTRTPDCTTLRRWRDEGLTQKQMVERTWDEFGERVTRSAIANAMVRCNLAGDRPRYEEEVPWGINAVHATAHPLKMLRLLGRRRAGNAMSAREEEQLDSWLATLKKNKWIVAYDPEDIQGFHYISSEYKDHKRPTPVRVKEINLNPM